MSAANTDVTVEAATGPAHSATRAFSADTVNTGAELTVTIDATDYGASGTVTETLPAGFDYGSSSLASSDVASAGQEVTFSLGTAPSDFTYTVTASDTAGTYDFSGVVTNEDGEEQDVGGDSTVTVEEPTPPAATHNGSRGFAPASVTQGGEVVVTITATGYGSFGSVEETLPGGFAYVSSSLAADDVEQSGQMVTFTLLGGGSFTYTVTASGTAGAYDFTGVLSDSDRVGVDIGGDSQVTVVAAAAAHSASRSFSCYGGGSRRRVER